MSKSMDMKSLKMGRKKPAVRPEIPSLEGQSIFISVGNTHELSRTKNHKEEWHTWKVYVHVLNEKKSNASGPSDHIKEVEFLLHPTFNKRRVKRKAPQPFCVERTGWGTFGVEIKMTMHSNRKIEFIHQLNFSKPVTEKVYEVELRKLDLQMINPQEIKGYDKHMVPNIPIHEAYVAGASSVPRVRLFCQHAKNASVKTSSYVRG
eukprot:m.168326 g.168326  ORF g.168326 m.168326 type:complete len:205 (+) comp18201_c0_seq2:448-1062(+)